ncbi:MAG: hypothetical protein PUB52_03550 [Lachnospiraceae bacterium]|nr:hypothetical protein [Lachnospiraceae bacterium]
MFGEDTQIKELKKKIQYAGGDMGVVKTWQKQLDRIAKLYPMTKNRYQSARQNLNCAAEAFAYIENMLMEGSSWNRDIKKQFDQMRKEIKHYKDCMDHEFLVSREDREFHSTFDSILRLMDRYDGGDVNRVILKSEVENIISMTAEILERPMPGLIALSFFYVDHDDSELVNIPPANRLKLIEENVEQDFWIPMLKVCAEVDFSQQQLLELVKRVVGG